MIDLKRIDFFNNIDVKQSLEIEAMGIAGGEECGPRPAADWSLDLTAECLSGGDCNGSFDFRALRWLDAHSAIEDLARLCPGNDRAS